MPKTKCLRLWGTQVTDENLEAVAELDDLKHLVIADGVKITDKGASHLSGLRHLQWLLLTECRITDKSLQVFSELPKLKVLNLESKHISDTGIQYLANLRRLKHLFIHGHGDQLNAVSDTGIMSLCSIPNLSFLGVTDTQVTDSGISSFVAKCPNCKVQR